MQKLKVHREIYVLTLKLKILYLPFPFSLAPHPSSSFPTPVRDAKPVLLLGILGTEQNKAHIGESHVIFSYVPKICPCTKQSFLRSFLFLMCSLSVHGGRGTEESVVCNRALLVFPG